MSDALRVELAGLAAQGATIKYQDHERAVVEHRRRPSLWSRLLGTVGAFVLAFAGGAIIGSANPEIGILAMPVILVVALVLTWRTSTQTHALWVDESGAVHSKRM